MKHIAQLCSICVHIIAKNGEIAETILLLGDPLRTKWIAKTFYENPRCFNKVRGMLGYTVTYKGKRISTRRTGMDYQVLPIMPMN